MIKEEMLSGGSAATRFFMNRNRTQSPPFTWAWILLWILMGIGWSLRLSELAKQNIWWDEARNIDVALRPFWQISSAPELDIQPPVYYWILHGWLNTANANRLSDPQVLAFCARFLSVWFGLLSIALLYQLGRRLHSPSAGLLAGLIGCLSPLWLAESQESRMYTLGFALLLAAALSLPQTATNPTRGQHSKSLLLFAALSALALLTHYNTLFILIAWYGWWGLWALSQAERWRAIRVPVATGLLTILLTLPFIPGALAQLQDYANPNLTAPTLTAYAMENWRGFLGGYAWTPELLNGWATPWLWLMAALPLIGLALQIHRPSSIVNLFFIFSWLLGGLALYYIAVLDRGAFNIRYSSFVTPALYLLLGIGLAGLGRLGRPVMAVALLLVLAGLTAGVWADRTDPRFFREDTAGLAAWLAQTTGPEDLILVDQKYPLGFYYPSFALEGDIVSAGTDGAPARYLFVDINTVDQTLNQWAQDAQRIYWVQWFESDTDPRNAVRFLLDQTGKRVGEQGFQGYRVNWWQMQPPNHFALAPHLTPLPRTFRQPESGGEVATLAVSLPAAPIHPGAKLALVLRWQVGLNPPQRPLKARIALYDPADNRLAQDDRRLLNDRHLAPSQWTATDQPLNVYTVSAPEDLAPGTYELRLLVYDAESLEALDVLDEAGNPAGIEILLGAVKVQTEP